MSNKIITIRLPEEAYHRVKLAAEMHAVGVSTFAKMLLMQKLNSDYMHTNSIQNDSDVHTKRIRSASCNSAVKESYKSVYDPESDKVHTKRILNDSDKYADSNQMMDEVEKALAESGVKATRASKLKKRRPQPVEDDEGEPEPSNAGEGWTCEYSREELEAIDFIVEDDDYDGSNLTQEEIEQLEDNRVVANL